MLSSYGKYGIVFQQEEESHILLTSIRIRCAGVFYLWKVENRSNFLKKYHGWKRGQLWHEESTWTSRAASQEWNSSCSQAFKACPPRAPDRRAAKTPTSCSLKDPCCSSADLPHYVILIGRRWQGRMKEAYDTSSYLWKEGTENLTNKTRKKYH